MAQQSTATLTGVQKASLLLLAVGQEAASSVLQKLSSEEVKLLSSNIAKMNNVDQETKASVLSEFATKHKGGFGLPGAEYVKQILENALGMTKAQELVSEIFLDSTNQPFTWLKVVNTGRLAATLRNERPQVIALILAYLSPSRAADVISQLPEQMQGDVAYRLGYMQSVSPEIALALEKVLESKLSREGSTALKAVGGINSLVAILNNADRATEAKILDYLENVEAEAAENVRQMLFTFDDIAKLDDQAVRVILQETEQEDIRLAMKGSPESMRAAFYKNMSERAAEAMKEDLEMMGRIKVKDVEAAQRRIVAVVRRLDEQGTISIRGNEEEFV